MTAVTSLPGAGANVPNYRLGSTDPKLGHDAGAGAWNSKSTDLMTHAKKAAILAVMGPAMAYPASEIRIRRLRT